APQGFSDVELSAMVTLPGEHVTLLPFQPASATEREFAALNDLNNALLAERLPEDPPATLEEAVRDYRAPTPREERHYWVAWDPASGVAVATARIWVCLD